MLILDKKGKYQRTPPITILKFLIRDINSNNSWETLKKVIILESVHKITNEMFSNIVNNKDFDLSKEYRDLVIKGWESKSFNDESKVQNKHFELFIDIIC